MVIETHLQLPDNLSVDDMAGNMKGIGIYSQH